MYLTRRQVSRAPRSTLPRVAAPGLRYGLAMVPRAAATVILLRGEGRQFEVLMVQRSPAARFMGGHWVFPGGALDAEDGVGQAGLMAAARRELAEEAGIRLDADAELVPFARWVTPAQSPIRFDTWSFLALAEPSAAGGIDGGFEEPRVDGVEIVAHRWLTPAAALTGFESGELQLAFPTERQLRQLAGFGSTAELLAHARERVDQIRPIQPRVVGTGDSARIVMPDESA